MIIITKKNNKMNKNGNKKKQFNNYNLKKIDKEILYALFLACIYPLYKICSGTYPLGIPSNRVK